MLSTVVLKALVDTTARVLPAATWLPVEKNELNRQPMNFPRRYLALR